MKRCCCGRLATHFVVLLEPDGEPKGKKLMCDAFPKCRPPADGLMRAAGKAAKVMEGWSDSKRKYAARITGVLAFPADGGGK